MTKLEEVARVIYAATKQDGCAAVPYEQLSDFATAQTQKMARAVIQALLETTDEMLQASPYRGKLTVVGAEYRAVIDAILNEKP